MECHKRHCRKQAGLPVWEEALRSQVTGCAHPPEGTHGGPAGPDRPGSLGPSEQGSQDEPWGRGAEITSSGL